MASKPTDDAAFLFSEQPNAVVAVLAPSSGAAEIFPHMRELGCRRLESLFGIPSRVMPSARMSNPTPQERAADINASFADPDVVAIVSTIGGDDCVRVLPFLDGNIISRNPKILLGYSDVTSLHLYLYTLLGKTMVLSLYGGALLCQFALSGPDMHEYTRKSFIDALSACRVAQMGVEPELLVDVKPSDGFQDGYLEWGEEANMTVRKEMEANDGFDWVGWLPNQDVCGLLWGGCLDVLIGHLSIGTYLPGGDSASLAAHLAGAVMFVETSEEFPSAYTVYQFFQSLGELGVLTSLSALLVGRPQTISRDRYAGPGGDRGAYKADQKAAVLRAIDEYCPSDAHLPVVFGLDFGHTDPQVLVPLGGTCYISASTQTIKFSYARHKS